MLNTMGKQAKTASRVLAVATTEQKNKALEAIAQALEANTETVLAANEKDLENGRSNGMSQALLDRLKLDEGRIRGIAAGVREVMALPSRRGAGGYGPARSHRPGAGGDEAAQRPETGEGIGASGGYRHHF